MSVRVMTAVWDTPLPPMEKLVLLALADCANDEGHCWPSAPTLARKSGQGERTVRRCIHSLILKGHLTQQQRLGSSPVYVVHPCQSGTPARAAPLPHRPPPLPERQATPARAAPKPLKKHQEPSNSISRAIPDDWQPREFGIGTQSRKVTDGWPPGELEAQLEQFKAHHRSKGNKFRDPQDAWSTWVLNTRKFGIGRDGRTTGRNERGNTREVFERIQAGLI